MSMRSIDAILLAAVLALACIGDAGAAEPAGRVTAVRGTDVTVSFDGERTLAVGDIILLSSRSSAGVRPVGTWRVTAVRGDGAVEAVAWKLVGPMGPPAVGMEATLAGAIDHPAEASDDPEDYDPLGPPRLPPDAWIAGDGGAVGGSPADAIFRRAVSFAAKDPARALELFTEAASLGHAEAAERAGTAWELGLGTVADDRKALAFYRQAAEAGRPLAQNNYGAFLANGRGGVPENDAEALAWYRKAAAQGDGWAQANLCLLYETGDGVEKDLDEALRLCRLSADQDNPMALNQLGWMAQRGVGVEKDLTEAFRLYERSAALGFANGQNNLGWVYEQGWGVSRDYEKAVYWYRQAASQGFAFAQWNLGRMYQEGLGVPRDEAAAVELFRRAARGGHVDARMLLEKKGLGWD